MERVVIYYSPYCPACRAPRRDTPADVVWRDLTQCIEEAAELGIRQPPAIVIGGRLRWQGAAAVRHLRDGMLR